MKDKEIRELERDIVKKEASVITKEIENKKKLQQQPQTCNSSTHESEESEEEEQEQE